MGLVPDIIVTGRGRVVVAYNLDLSGEAIAKPRHRLDARLPTTIVVHRFACGMYAGIDRGFRNNAALPNNRDQFISADEAIMILDKMTYEVEHLRLEIPKLAPDTKLVPIGVQLIFSEFVQHRSTSSSRSWPLAPLCSANRKEQ
jgi:hypothetical protein